MSSSPSSPSSPPPSSPPSPAQDDSVTSSIPEPEVIAVMESLIDQLDQLDNPSEEAEPPYVEPPYVEPPLLLQALSLLCLSSQSTFLASFSASTSLTAVCVANLVDRVVDLNTTFPFDLRSAASSLDQSLGQFLKAADPVYICLNSLQDAVEARIESERREVCLAVIDSCITRIKRAARTKEPARVLRFLDHTAAYEDSLVKSTLTSLTARVEKKVGMQKFRSSVARGDLLPPLQLIDVAHEVDVHLTFMTSWLEKEVFYAEMLQTKQSEKDVALAAFPEEFEKVKHGDRAELDKTLPTRRKRAMTESLANLEASRDKELLAELAKFTDPETPAPPDLASDFNKETTAQTAQLKKELTAQWEATSRTEKEELETKLKEKEIAARASVGDQFETKLSALSAMVLDLHSCKPGFSALSPPFFNPPPPYSNDDIVDQECRLSTKNRQWTTYIDEVVLDPDLNYLADKILIYLPERDATNTIACVSKSFERYSLYFKNRIVQSVVVQSLYRRAMARKELKRLKLNNNSAKFLQRNGRAMLGRMRATRIRKTNAIYFSLKTKMGASSSVVKSLLEGSDTTESFIAAAETLSTVATASATGTKLVFETDAPNILVEKMLNKQKLSLTMTKTQSGKSDWSAFIKLLGNLNLKDANTKQLIKEKSGGKMIINMMRRGDSSVREEACRTIQKMMADKELMDYFVYDLQCVPLLVHMIRSTNSAEEHHATRRMSGHVRDMSQKAVARSGEQVAGFVLKRGRRKIEEQPEHNEVVQEMAFSTNHKLFAVNLVSQIMKDSLDLGIRKVLGRCGLIPNLVQVIDKLVESHEEIGLTKDRVRLLERSAKITWRLIEIEENYDRIIQPGTGKTLQSMLTSSWHLANRLGCVMTACLVSTDPAKILLQQYGVPSLLNRQLVSNSADVRAAALVAIQAFSEKASNTTSATFTMHPSQVSFSMARPRSNFVSNGIVAGEWSGEAPNNLSREVGDEILLVKEPIGVKLTHSGTSLSDTAKYLKDTHITLPPMKRYRLESALNMDAIPWVDSDNL